MNNQPSTVPSDAEREQELAAIEAKRAEKLQTFRHTLEMQSSRHTRATTEFAEGVTKNGLLWALEWSGRQTAQTIAQAELWAQVERMFDHGIAEYPAATAYNCALEALETVRAEVEKGLLNNWVRKSSTDEFSNAVSGARAEGHARFYEEATSLFAYLTKQ